MFLWVRLILISLEDANSVQELRRVVHTFPKELGDVYGRILETMRKRLTISDYTKVIRTLSWITFAKRPLRLLELEYGSILYSDNTIINHETKPLGNLLDVCKPLVEENANRSVVFIHSSVKE